MRQWVMVFVLALSAIVSRAAVAQSTLRLGVEFQVNAYTPGAQERPGVDRDADGDFVVAWASDGQDGSQYGVFARRFSSSGVALGTDLQVATRTLGNQRFSGVGMSAGGSFVVVWRGYIDSEFYGIFARRFDSAGSALGGEIEVTTADNPNLGYPAVDLAANGDFVVVWQSPEGPAGLDVFGRRFDAAGGPLGIRFPINTVTLNTQRRPRIARSTNGFVVVWQSDQQDGDGYGIFGRRFDANGGALATEFQINGSTVKRQAFPEVSASSGGAFVVAWVPYEFFAGGMGMDVSAGISARRFDSSGAPTGPEFQVKYALGDHLYSPAVALRESGDFIVAWEDGGSGFSRIRARHFDASGFPRGADFMLNVFTESSQRSPHLAVDWDGEFVAVWHSQQQDGESYGNFGRRLATLSNLDVDGDGSTDPLTDGLLTLRYHFGFTGNTLTDGAVSDECSRCTPEVIHAFLLSQE